MDEQRIRAYRTVLAQALLHLKWDLAGLLGGFRWFQPWSLLAQTRAAYRAAFRAWAFHNLAIHSVKDFSGLREDEFWNDIARFQQRFPQVHCPYAAVFERCLLGEPVNIMAS